MNDHEDFRRQLIAEVRCHDYLWNNNSRMVSKQEMRQRTWENIAKKLGKTVPEVRSTWDILRGQYRHEFRKNQGAVKWKYFDDLSFLSVKITCDTQMETAKSECEAANGRYQRREKTWAEFNRFRKKLIEEVRLHECLWIGGPGSKGPNGCNNQRQNVWKEIAKKLGRKVQEVRSTWLNLRIQYCRVTRRGINCGNKPKWVHYEDMSFLRKVIPYDSLKSQPIEKSTDIKKEPSEELEEVKSFVQVEEALTSRSDPIIRKIPSCEQKDEPIFWTDGSFISSEIKVEPIEFLSIGKSENMQHQQQPDQDVKHSNPDSFDEITDFWGNVKVETSSLCLQNDNAQFSLCKEVANASNTEICPNSTRQNAGELIGEVKIDKCVGGNKFHPTKITLPIQNTALDDEDLNFAMSIVPSLRRVECNRKPQIRMEIIKILMRELDENNK